MMGDESSSVVIIRPMTAEDVPVIAAWMVEIPLWQRYGVKRDQAETMFSKALTTGDWLFVADVEASDGTIWPRCGFAWCMPGGGFGRGAYLRLIGVQPTQARSGIGGALLERIEAEASRRFQHMFLLVSDFNHDAQRFYQRHGYTQVGAIDCFVLPDVIEFIYWKRLLEASSSRRLTE